MEMIRDKQILNETVSGLGITKIEDKWLTEEEKAKLFEIKVASGAIILE